MFIHYDSDFSRHGAKIEESFETAKSNFSKSTDFVHSFKILEKKNQSKATVCFYAPGLGVNH